MNQEVLNQQKRVNTEDVSLDGFIVKETLASHLVPNNNKRTGKLNAAGLRKIQGRKRAATIRLYNRYL